MNPTREKLLFARAQAASVKSFDLGRGFRRRQCERVGQTLQSQLLLVSIQTFVVLAAKVELGQLIFVETRQQSLPLFEEYMPS